MFTRLMAGKVVPRFTIQLLVPPGPRLVGLHERLETKTAFTRLIVAVCELAPSVAVMIAVSLFGIEPDAVALKVTVAEPDATVTEAGTDKSGLLLESVTLAPPAGAVCTSVIVHKVTPP
jgi:hypothetical protein